MIQEISKKIERNILLNPGPATTTMTVKESMVVPDICPREDEFGQIMQNVRKKALKVVNGEKSHECILLGGSGTGAIEACVSSCCDKNDEILILSNGAYGKRMEQICLALGINYQILEFDWNKVIEVSKVEEYLETKQSKPRVMAFIHHETTTGLLNPLKDLIQLCEKYQIVSLVDAMSSYAGMEIDLATTKADYLVSSSNKCIQGMAGVGIVLISKNELQTIKTFQKRSFYFDLSLNYYAQEEKGQFAFTPPVQVLYALDKAMDEFFEEGGENRYQRYAELYHLMFEGMVGLGFEPFIESQYHSKILTTFNEPVHKNYSFEKMHEYLYQRNITIYPGKIGEFNTFRLSNLGDLNKRDIEYFLEQMSSYLKQYEILL